MKIVYFISLCGSTKLTLISHEKGTLILRKGLFLFSE